MTRASGWALAANPRVRRERSASTAVVDILFALALLAGVVAVYRVSKAEPAEVTVVRQYLQLEAQGDQEAVRPLLVNPDTFQAVPRSVAQQAIQSIRRYRAVRMDGSYDYVLVRFGGGTALRFDMELFPTMERAPRIVSWSLQ